MLAIVISPTASDGSRIFLQAGNLTDILRQVSLIGIISLAMTFVILTGGIDLSVGSILALSTALVAMFLTRGYTTHIAVAILAAVAAAAAGRSVERRGDRAHRYTAVHRDAGHHDRCARPGEVAHQQSEHRYRFRAGPGGRIRRDLPREGHRNRRLRLCGGDVLGGAGADRLRPSRARRGR